MTGFNLPVSELRRVIRTVAPAASTDEARPILCGVLVELDKDGETETEGRHFPDIDSLYALTGVDEGASAFHPKYLRDVFDAAQVWSDTYPVRTLALNALKPCRFTVIAPTVGTLDMLLMPVRIPPPPGESG